MGWSERRERQRRARELEQKMRELDDLDHRFGVGALPGTQPDPRGPVGPARPRRGRRRMSATIPGLMVTALLVGFVVVVAPGDTYSAVRRLVGIGPDRLSAAPDVPDGPGVFRFSMTQPGSEDPVGYDPCRPVRVEVNPDHAPDDWRRVVETSARHTAEATGLEISVVGTTEDRDFFERRQQPLGDPPPVLVGWATDEEVEALGGDVAGLGGSTAVGTPGARRYYTTGSVVLDADTFHGLSAGGERERAAAQAIVDHEFGHLVGLAHVDDRRELMFAKGVGRTDYGAGDRKGLAALGAVPCR